MDLIAAVDNCWAIGREGRLLWSIPEDHRRFRDLTWGHSVVYGRKTMATFPDGAPLPGRRNYVLTHRPDAPRGDAVFLTSLEQVVALDRQVEKLYIIGGASVYRALLDRCDRAYITKIDADGEGDAFFSDLDARPEWELSWCSETRRWQGLGYHFCVYTRREGVE